MMTLRQLAAEPPTMPTRTAWYLADLGEARGKQELFTRQSPKKGKGNQVSRHRPGRKMGENRKLGIKLRIGSRP